MQTTAAPSLAQQIHRQAIMASPYEMANLLQEVLSRRLAAYAAGVQDGKTIGRWASGEITEVRDFEVERRLRTTYEIVQLLLTQDTAQTVKAWFIGLNPELDDVSPIEAIHDGRLKDALLAARVFSVNG